MEIPLQPPKIFHLIVYQGLGFIPSKIMKHCHGLFLIHRAKSSSLPLDLKLASSSDNSPIWCHWLLSAKHLS